MRFLYKLIIIVGLVGWVGTSSSVWGQLIENSNGQAFTDSPFFNEKIIRQKKIKSISGKEIHYKLGDALRHTEYFRNYYFNKKGQLVRQLESIQVTKETDTLVSLFEYDADGNLTALRQRDEYGFYAYIYAYDEQGRVIKEEYRRNLSKNHNKTTQFKLGKEFTVFEEKSTYRNFDNQQKRTFYNSNGLPYKDEFTYYLESGLIDRKVELLKKTKGKKTTHYFYNESKRLDSVIIQSNVFKPQKRKFEYYYDNEGNLTNRRFYKNGEYVSQREVLYDEETNLIDDILIQNIATDFIRVLELRNYKYFSP